MHVGVSVPATSANLGPGFDCLGLALGIRDEYEVIVTPGAAVSVVSEGESSDDLPADGDHLVARALLAMLAAAGQGVAGLELRCRNSVPQSRGLGSSAAAIVGGVALGAALAGVDDHALMLDVATRIEGHPDNVAAALLGGLTVAWTSHSGGHATRLPVVEGVIPVVFIPEGTSPTERARAALPATVPFAAAAFNVARAALLLAALTRDPALLLPATEDQLHQEQRRDTYPQSFDLVTRLRGSDHAAAISGAGPAVLVLAGGAEEARTVAATPAPGFRAVVSEIGEGVATTRFGGGGS